MGKSNKNGIRKEDFKVAEKVVNEAESLSMDLMQVMGLHVDGQHPTLVAHAGGSDGTGIDRGRDPEDAGKCRHRGCKGEIPLSTGQ